MRKLLTMFFVFTLMLVNTTSIYAGELTPTNKILVNGVEIENEPERKMELGDGTIEYFDGDRSLLLDGVNDTSVSIVMPDGSFIIKLRGENKISDISAYGNLRITIDDEGYGDLDLISSKPHALYVKETLEIEKIGMTIKSNDIGIKNDGGFALRNTILHIEADNFGILASSIDVKDANIALDIPNGYGLYSANSSLYVNYAEIVSNTKKAALYADINVEVYSSILELTTTDESSIYSENKVVVIRDTDLIIDEPKDFREDLVVYEGDADYSEIQKLWKRVPENYNEYTKESAAALIKVIQSLSEIENLDYDQQHLVDAKAKEFKEALDNLELKKEEVLDLSWDANKDSEGVEFSVDWDAENFVALFVDGKELANKKDFTYKSGSTVINLLPKYLKTLKTGEYDIKVVFMYAKDFDGVLKVVNNDLVDKKEEVKPETKPAIPPTGISDNTYTYISILFVSLIYTLKFRKKKYY